MVIQRLFVHFFGLKLPQPDQSLLEELLKYGRNENFRHYPWGACFKFLHLIVAWVSYVYGEGWDTHEGLGFLFFSSFFFFKVKFSSEFPTAFSAYVTVKNCFSQFCSFFLPITLFVVGAYTFVPWLLSFKRGRALEEKENKIVVKETGYFFIYGQVCSTRRHRHCLLSPICAHL